MDTKRITLILLTIFFLTAQTCLAGETTIRGTMSCYIPPQIEMKTQNENGLAQGQAPSVTTSASYDVIKEEKIVSDEEMLQTEKTSVEMNDTGAQRQVTVYSICAK
jgi:hypothetical protein